MMTLRTIPNRQRRFVPKTLAVPVVVWLNVVFQTCAMAYGAMDDCPHCPAGMHGDATASMPMDCGMLDPVDDPDFLPAIKNPGGHAPLAYATSWLTPFAPIRPHSTVPAGPLALWLHGPPPNVLFCVYLN